MATLGAFVSADIRFGSCPSVTVEENFDIESYTGKWYEIYRDRTFFWSTGGDCVTAEYTLQDDGSTVTVDNSQMSILFRYRGSFEGEATCESSGNCYVSFFGGSVDSPNYQVIDTDYTTYTLIFGCSDMLGGLFHS